MQPLPTPAIQQIFDTIMNISQTLLVISSTVFLFGFLAKLLVLQSDLFEDEEDEDEEEEDEEDEEDEDEEEDDEEEDDDEQDENKQAQEKKYNEVIADTGLSIGQIFFYALFSLILFGIFKFFF